VDNGVEPLNVIGFDLSYVLPDARNQLNVRSEGAVLEQTAVKTYDVVPGPHQDRNQCAPDVTIVTSD
jgi:hypothetical protein